MELEIKDDIFQSIFKILDEEADIDDNYMYGRSAYGKFIKQQKDEVKVKHTLTKSSVITSKDGFVKSLQTLIWWYFCCQIFFEEKFNKVAKNIDYNRFWILQKEVYTSEDYFRFQFECYVRFWLHVLRIGMCCICCYLFRHELYEFGIYMSVTPIVLFGLFNVLILYLIYRWLNYVYQPNLLLNK